MGSRKRCKSVNLHQDFYSLLSFSYLNSCISIWLLLTPLVVEPGYFLVKAGLLKCFHAGRDIIAAVLRPALMVTIASSLDSSCKFLHEGIHCGINILVEAFPVIPHSFLEVSELGYLANPSYTAIARQIFIDVFVKLVG